MCNAIISLQVFKRCSSSYILTIAISEKKRSRCFGFSEYIMLKTSLHKLFFTTSLGFFIDDVIIKCLRIQIFMCLSIHALEFKLCSQSCIHIFNENKMDTLFILIMNGLSIYYVLHFMQAIF